MSARERRAVWAFWSDTPPWLRRSSAASVAAGTVLLVLGLWGDAAGFWEGLDYLTSMVSGLTGLAFGIPAALLVYSRLTEARAEADLRRQMLRRARVAGADFHRAVFAAFDTADRDTVLEALHSTRARNAALARALHAALHAPADTDELHRLLEERNDAWRWVGRR
ncbi:hypothetical protein IDM40_20435 [Nocardiopsis sp. HNM0947]|uniref:Uncharacterized protein n=1 Tax=Nocardiopsis coralli TaxID=2772213 RepID=A0ABR9PB24_9ACTN|nr:hypothetical protein [Nocardiopsis coralli]MBE3001041.1 hypothetical protein [Nocardiopsis coralli]